ncbi:hypothetical protein F0562_005943 [Nyssa sinensis]|uniref:Uncharacterized protein n=1 Tax=Nyssa sinensis TaxID=561372 RepID=A0A5J5ALU6_9ASTE|nr:hypothetical protein F0562_005943 [Nyssa sinensis]
MSRVAITDQQMLGKAVIGPTDVFMVEGGSCEAFSVYGTTVASQGLDGVLLGGKGFGAPMEVLFNYLGLEYGNTFALASCFAFLSGLLDYGTGHLDTRRYGEQYASKGEDADRASLPMQTPFYKDLAAVACSSRHTSEPLMLQITFQYTVVMPPEELSSSRSSSAGGTKHSLKRRLRI